MVLDGNENEKVGNRQFLKQLNIVLSDDPASLLLGIYPRQMKIHVYTTTCTQLFIAVPFLMAKRWR